MQAHGAQREPAFAEAAPDRIHRVQREDEPAVQHGGGVDIHTQEKIVSTLDVLSEQFHGPVMRG
jgi:hypothetical protein